MTVTHCSVVSYAGHLYLSYKLEGDSKWSQLQLD